MKILNKENPTFQTDVRKYVKGTIKITPEMIQFMIKNFADYTNNELGEKLGISDFQVSQVATLIRRKGIKMEKKRTGLKYSFEDSFNKINIK